MLFEVTEDEQTQTFFNQESQTSGYIHLKASGSVSLQRVEGTEEEFTTTRNFGGGLLLEFEDVVDQDKFTPPSDKDSFILRYKPSAPSLWLGEMAVAWDGVANAFRPLSESQFPSITSGSIVRAHRSCRFRGE